MPLALVAFAVTAGFRNPEDPYYFGAMLLFFTLLGWWALLEGLKRRVAATDSGLVAHSPWRGEPVRFAWAQVARITFSPQRWPLVFANRAGEKIRVGTMMSGLDQLIAAARRYAPADVHAMGSQNSSSGERAEGSRRPPRYASSTWPSRTAIVAAPRSTSSAQSGRSPRARPAAGERS